MRNAAPDASGADCPPSRDDLFAVAQMLDALPELAAQRVGHALGQILAGIDAAEALGVKLRPGQRSLAAQERLARRDELLQRLAGRHYGKCTARQAGLEIASQWKRYSASAGLARDIEIGLAREPDSIREYLLAIALLPEAPPGAVTIARCVMRATPFSRHTTDATHGETMEFPNGHHARPARDRQSDG